LDNQKFIRIFKYKKLITKTIKMKKLVLVLAVMALVAVSCKKVEAPARLTTVDSTTVQVDSVRVDSTTVDTTTVK
jgi:hypothetical protein